MNNILRQWSGDFDLETHPGLKKPSDQSQISILTHKLRSGQKYIKKLYEKVSRNKGPVKIYRLPRPGFG